jgi:microcystin degradation protein MlrC
VPRIAIAGFQHETNSFATSIAGLAEFEMADAWPSLLTGDEVITGTHGMNLPIAGFAQAARAHPEIELTPILWASAEPSGPVTAEAFDTITGRILDGLHAARADGIYLDLHGAMITERAFDGEGALLRLIREHVGPDLPIAISLDLHANVTNAMVELATSIAIFRTYPHLDMAETGARCLPRLLSHIAGHRPAKALRRVPYLIPLHAQFTGASPARELYGRVAGTQGAELAMGFTGSDMPDTGPAVVIHAEDQATADRTAEDLLDALLEAEGMFPGLPPSANEAVRDALSRPPGKPILIADVEDNAGGGASSDTTGLLRALIDAGADKAILALMDDPQAAARAHEAGPGATIETTLGGRSGCAGDAPLHARFEVIALSDGTVPFEGEVYRGGTAQIGDGLPARSGHARRYPRGRGLGPQPVPLISGISACPEAGIICVNPPSISARFRDRAGDALHRRSRRAGQRSERPYICAKVSGLARAARSMSRLRRRRRESGNNRLIPGGIRAQ